MADVGFEIQGRFYPSVEAFTLGDPVLIRDITGLDFVTFAEMHDELVTEIANSPDGEAEVDPVLLAGIVGVAVWHANPTWRRDRVVRYVQSLPQGSVKFVGDEEDEESPPAEAPADTDSGGTPADSSSSAGAPAIQNGSGDPTSAIGAGHA